MTWFIIGSRQWGALRQRKSHRVLNAKGIRSERLVLTKSPLHCYRRREILYQVYIPLFFLFTGNETQVVDVCGDQLVYRSTRQLQSAAPTVASLIEVIEDTAVK